MSFKLYNSTKYGVLIPQHPEQDVSLFQYEKPVLSYELAIARYISLSDKQDLLPQILACWAKAIFLIPNQNLEASKKVID